MKCNIYRVGFYNVSSKDGIERGVEFKKPYVSSVGFTGPCRYTARILESKAT